MTKNNLNPEAVLEYWFGPVDPPADNYRQRWFSGDEAVDNEIQTGCLFT
jgi:uncharacterized protein (DUF924 family)